MARVNSQSSGRRFERLFMGLLTLVFGLLFFSLYQVLQRDFEEVQKRISEGSMVNLNAGKTAEKINNLMVKGYYFDDKKDIALIRSVVEQGNKDNILIDNIGELNKRRFFVNAEQAYSEGGTAF